MISETWRQSSFYVDEAARAFIFDLQRDNDSDYFAYVFYHYTPRSARKVNHGVIVVDEDHYPLDTFYANRRKESRKILEAMWHILLDIAKQTLTKRYEEEMREWNWDESTPNVEYDSDAGAFIGRAWLGDCFALTPSGKYYQPWACSNVDNYEAFQDECWNDALETVVQEHGYNTFWEGTDIFVEKYLLEVGDFVKTKTPIKQIEMEMGGFDERVETTYPIGTVGQVDHFDDEYNPTMIAVKFDDSETVVLTYDQVERTEVEHV